MSSAIRAAVLLPPRDDLPAMRGEVASLLAASADGRAEVLFVDQQGSAAERADALRAFLRKETPLALVASFTEGADAELAAVANEMEVPLLATLSSHPRSSIAPSRWLRDLCGGVIEQSSALLRMVEGKNVALLGGDEEIEIPGTQPFDEDHDFDAILLAGPVPLPKLERRPALLLPSSVLPPTAFDDVQGEVWVALPFTPLDEEPFAAAKYADLVRRNNISTAYRGSQLAALTSLQLFLDALGRCGGETSREALLRAVDDTRGFRSGLLPPLTYGEGRHIGSTGAWVIPLHERRPPVWVESGS